MLSSFFNVSSRETCVLFMYIVTGLFIFFWFFFVLFFFGFFFFLVSLREFEPAAACLSIYDS